jgi:hypothetical protein
MTDERPQNDLVTATYRQLADERSPKHLDDAVLRLAADHAQRSRYSRSIGWTRPLAWAATIALCLAITFEVARVPAPEVAPGRPAASAPLLNKREADETRVDALAEERESIGHAERKQAVDMADQPAAPRAVFDLPSADSDPLRQAEEIARVQSSKNNEPAAQANAMRASAGSAAAESCPEKARAAPDSWLQCIKRLEESGANEAATLERKLLLAAFPDFHLP